MYKSNDSFSKGTNQLGDYYFCFMTVVFHKQIVSCNLVREITVYF